MAQDPTDEPEKLEEETQPREKVVAEAQAGIPTLIAKQQAVLSHLAKGGSSGISGDFGKLRIESDEVQAALEASLTQPLGDAGSTSAMAIGARKEEKKAPDLARDFEKRGIDALAEAHKNLQVTTDGSAPPVFDYQDKFTVKADTSAIDFARQQLGPAATKAQIDHYAMQVLLLNDKLKDTVENGRLEAGSVIRLPGQTADGGVFSIMNGRTSVEWSDGTRKQTSESGDGSVNFTSADGAQVEITWNSRDAHFTGESRMKDTLQSKTDAYGRTTESVWIDAKDDFLETKITTKDDKGRTFITEFTPGKPVPDRIVVTESDGRNIELKPGKNGEFVSADGSYGLSRGLDLYKRTEEGDGSVTRTYGDGNTDKFDAKGRIVRSAGTDDWGRKFVHEYKPGDKMPHTATITEKNGTVVELKRQKNNSYRTDYIKDGEKVGSIELGPDGRLLYKNDKEKTVRTELKDGVVLEKKTNADKTSSITYTKDKEGFVVQYDGKGHKTSEVYSSEDGRKFTKVFSNAGKRIDSIKIDGPDGSVTELRYDPAAESFKGQRVDSRGNLLEHVGLQEDKLVFVDAKTGAVRAEKFIKPGDTNAIPRFQPGQYDKDTGTFTYENADKVKVTESFAPGRTDTIKADGTIQGTTTTGDFSFLKKDGEATVMHANGTGVRLNADGTIDRWGPEEADNAHKEKLSAVEDKYLKAHAEIDRRDFAEIHRKLVHDPAKLDAFYSQLEKIDSARNLSDTEKTALRRDIMHHVAYPGEIYQGRTPSCNVSVVQRDLAMLSPDRYTAHIVQAVSEGSITTADGNQVPLDPANLKLSDSSGRDLASRIFQSMAIAAEFHPARVFRNSEDGVGRLYPSPYNPADKPTVFAGMNMAHITDVRYKLTGEEKAVTMVENVNELVKAYELNGGGPMIIGVDGSKPPFENNGPVGTGESANHVVTVTRIERSGSHVLVYLHNQWGLESDHSTFETAIDGAKLVENMKVKVQSDGKTITGPAFVISRGDHRKAFDITSGKLVEDKSLSETLKKGVKLIPGEKQTGTPAARRH